MSASTASTTTPPPLPTASSGSAGTTASTTTAAPPLPPTASSGPAACEKTEILDGVWIIKFEPGRALFMYENIKVDEQGIECKEEDDDITNTAHSVLIRRYKLELSQTKQGLVQWYGSLIRVVRDIVGQIRAGRREADIIASLGEGIFDQAVGGSVQRGKVREYSGTCNASFVAALFGFNIDDSEHYSAYEIVYFCRMQGRKKNMIMRRIKSRMSEPLDGEPDEGAWGDKNCFLDRFGISDLVEKWARRGMTSPEKPFIVDGSDYKELMKRMINTMFKQTFLFQEHKRMRIE